MGLALPVGGAWGVVKLRTHTSLTGPFAYLRPLGDREPVDALTPTLDHIVIDRAGQVAEDARAIQILRQRVPVVAFVNNHYAGYAPETVRQLQALTGQAIPAGSGGTPG